MLARRVALDTISIKPIHRTLTKDSFGNSTRHPRSHLRHRSCPSCGCLQSSRFVRAYLLVVGGVTSPQNSKDFGSCRKTDRKQPRHSMIEKMGTCRDSGKALTLPSGFQFFVKKKKIMRFKPVFRDDSL